MLQQIMARMGKWTRASPQATMLEELSGPAARVLGLALRAADRGSRTHAAKRRQAASGAGPAAAA
jgi:hypothetical protein